MSNLKLPQHHKFARAIWQPMEVMAYAGGAGQKGFMPYNENGILFAYDDVTM